MDYGLLLVWDAIAKPATIGFRVIGFQSKLNHADFFEFNQGQIKVIQP